MNSVWDGGDIAFRSETWEVLTEHLYPGAFIFAFAGSRGYHRMATAIEDAGLIIHPAICWTFGSGFPKATRIKTGEEIETGETETLSDIRSGNMHAGRDTSKGMQAIWSGHRYGLQALKPAAEFICVAQKPYQGRPVDSITETGAGALNIEEGRIRTTGEIVKRVFGGRKGPKHGGKYNNSDEYWSNVSPSGRWPSNFVLSHSPLCVRMGEKKVKAHNATTRGGKTFGGDQPYKYKEGMALGYTDSDGLESIEEWECETNCPVRMLSKQGGAGSSPKETKNSGRFSVQPGGNGKTMQEGWYGDRIIQGYGDTGSVARFFHNSDWVYEIEERIDEASPVYYCAKSGRKERDLGLENIPVKARAEITGRREGSAGLEMAGGKGNPYAGITSHIIHNGHPTVKPIKLCQYLAALLLPPIEYAPRRLLVPFSGSSSEMIGGLLAGWEEIIGIEMSSEYCAIAEARLSYWSGHTPSKPIVSRKVEKVSNAPTQLKLDLT